MNFKSLISQAKATVKNFAADMNKTDVALAAYTTGGLTIGAMFQVFTDDFVVVADDGWTTEFDNLSDALFHAECYPTDAIIMNDGEWTMDL